MRDIAYVVKKVGEKRLLILSLLQPKIFDHTTLTSIKLNIAWDSEIKYSIEGAVHSLYDAF